MFYHFLLIQLMLFRASIATVDQTCVWKDGSTATGYLPCTNSTATSGSCCLSGESCLGSGLCYGNIGLVYRGACINSWGGSCPTYCDDVTSEWANLFPCPFANTGSLDGPQSWWCGAMGTTVCTASNESHFITILPSVATKLLLPSSTASVVTVTMIPSSTTSTASSTSSSSTSTLSTGPTSTISNTNASQPSSTATTNSDQSHPPSPTATSVSTNNGTAIGLGVGLGGLFLACLGLGAWAYQSYRRQKKQLEQMINASKNQQGRPTDYTTKPELSDYSGYGVYREMGSGPQPTELDAGRTELGGR